LFKKKREKSILVDLTTLTVEPLSKVGNSLLLVVVFVMVFVLQFMIEKYFYPSFCHPGGTNILPAVF
jgi:hypothetical protein